MRCRVSIVRVPHSGLGQWRTISATWPTKDGRQMPHIQVSSMLRMNVKSLFSSPHLAPCHCVKDVHANYTDILQILIARCPHIGLMSDNQTSLFLATSPTHPCIHIPPF